MGKEEKSGIVHMLLGSGMQVRITQRVCTHKRFRAYKNYGSNQ